MPAASATAPGPMPERSSSIARSTCSSEIRRDIGTTPTRCPATRHGGILAWPAIVVAWCRHATHRRVGRGMSTTIRDGVRVAFPPKHTCPIHGSFAMVQTEGEVGTVDRLDDRFGDHPIIVVFNTLRHPPFNDPWVEGFSPVELQ